MRIFNIAQTYIDKNYPWLKIASAAALEILSTERSLKVYISVKVLLDCDMILQIKDKVD